MAPYSLILPVYLLGSVCPAGGRPPDMQNTVLWRLLSVCVALTERTDKTTHTNWVLQQPQSHNALSLPRGQCVWLFLCSDIQGVYRISVCVCAHVCEGLDVSQICVSTTPTDLRAQCPCAIRNSSGSKRNGSSGVCSHTKCPAQPEVPPNGSPTSCFLGLDMTISNVIVSQWPFKDLELIKEKMCLLP